MLLAVIFISAREARCALSGEPVRHFPWLTGSPGKMSLEGERKKEKKQSVGRTKLEIRNATCGIERRAEFLAKVKEPARCRCNSSPSSNNPYHLNLNAGPKVLARCRLRDFSPQPQTNCFIYQFRLRTFLVQSLLSQKPQFPQTRACSFAGSNEKHRSHSRDVGRRMFIHHGCHRPLSVGRGVYSAGPQPA